MLDDLAIKYGTDKSSWVHNYTYLYEKYFEPFKDKPVKLLEIGIQEGASLRMWEEYFPHGNIYGLDIKECFEMDTKRITTIKGNQSNKRHLRQIIELFGPFDIIIDDGSHVNKDLLISFEELFPALKAGGIYVAEDLHTCYWGGGFGRPKFIKRLKKVIDQVNGGGKSGVADILKDGPVNYIKHLLPMTMWEKSIEYAHFYRSIVFLKRYG